MLERKLNLASIAKTIEKVDMSRVKEAIPNSVKSTISASSAAISKSKVSNEIGDVLNDYCDTKSINKVSKDYLSNLDRTLKLHPELELCDAVKITNPIESILVKNTKLPTTPDFSDLVKTAVNTEMNNAGLIGSIPDCLFNGILGKIGKLGSFGGLSLQMRLDLLSMIKDSCTKDMVNSLVGGVLEQEATKNIIDGLLESSPSKGFEYIANKSNVSPMIALGALDSSLNEKESKHTLSKLTAYNKLKNDDTTTITKPRGVSDNFLNNLEINSQDDGYDSDNFDIISEGIVNMGGMSTYDKLRGKTNLSNMAKDNMANKKSTDDINNPSKATTIDFSIATVLTNAFV